MRYPRAARAGLVTAFAVTAALFLMVLALPSNVLASGAPTAPTDLEATGNTSSSVTLTWTNPSDESLINTIVYYGTSSCGSLTAIPVGSVVDTYTVTGLSSGTLYGFEVAGVNSDGNGTPTSCVTEKTAGLPTPPPLFSWSDPADVQALVILVLFGAVIAVLIVAVWVGRTRRRGGGRD